MKKKQIDTQSLANELQQTGFFRPRVAPQPQQEQPKIEPLSPAFPPQHVPAPPHQSTPADTRTPRTGSTGRTPRRRQMFRHPFEVYQDQVEQLRELALNDRRNGGTGSMSRMVREGIDRIIAERRREGEQ